MGVLEIIAEQRLGEKALQQHPKLRAAFYRAEKATQMLNVSSDEKARIQAIVELCFEYERETDALERANILRTLEEISSNDPLELPIQTVDEWNADMLAKDSGYSKLAKSAEQRTQLFLKKYFSLRAKAGLATQAAVARASGLKRGYIAVIETGEHFPQQKTLQKLAKAFGVDITELLP